MPTVKLFVKLPRDSDQLPTFKPMSHIPIQDLNWMKWKGSWQRITLAQCIWERSNYCAMRIRQPRSPVTLLVFWLQPNSFRVIVGNGGLLHVAKRQTILFLKGRLGNFLFDISSFLNQLCMNFPEQYCFHLQTLFAAIVCLGFAQHSS